MAGSASSSHVAPEADGRPSARGRALILLLFVVAYATACMLPAFHLEGRREVWRGMEVMVLGAWGLGRGQFAWLANLTALAALGCVMTGRTLRAMILSAVSGLLGLHALVLVGQVISLGRGEGNEARVVSLGAGYLVWMGALLLPLLLALLLRQKRPLAPAPEL